MVRDRVMRWLDGAVKAAIAVTGVISIFILAAFGWLMTEGRWIAFLLGMLCMHLQGCSTPPTPAADPRDPDVYRPVNPQYPMP